MSVKDRILFLSGLFETCGKFDEETSIITISVKTEPIAKKVRSIIWSLGGICDMRFSHINGKFNLKINFSNNHIKE
jgi:hypothetical protein